MRTVPNAENIQTDWKNKVLTWFLYYLKILKEKSDFTIRCCQSLNRTTEGMTLGKYKEELK